MRLVGRLVGAETGVPVNSVYGFLGVGDVVGRELHQLSVDCSHQFEHGFLRVLLIQVLARLEPLAAVVALQTSKELDHFRREAGESGWHRVAPLIAQAQARATLPFDKMPVEPGTLQRLAQIPNLTISVETLLSRYTRFGIGGPAAAYVETA